MMNRVVLVGRITADPEVMRSKNDKAYCRFSIAVNRIMEDGADFFNCVAFGKVAENMGRFVTKGSIIGVDGTLKQSSYKRKDGTNATSIDVIANTVSFIDTRNKSNNSAPRPTSSSSSNVKVSLSGANQNTYGSESISFDPDPEPSSSGISYDEIPWGD